MNPEMSVEAEKCIVGGVRWRRVRYFQHPIQCIFGGNVKWFFSGAVTLCSAKSSVRVDVQSAVANAPAGRRIPLQSCFGNRLSLCVELPKRTS